PPAQPPGARPGDSARAGSAPPARDRDRRAAFVSLRGRERLAPGGSVAETAAREARAGAGGGDHGGSAGDDRAAVAATEARDLTTVAGEGEGTRSHGGLTRPSAGRQQRWLRWSTPGTTGNHGRSLAECGMSS